MKLSVPLVTPEAIEWHKTLQSLPISEARQTFISLMRSVSHDDISVDLFRDRIVLALDVAKIPSEALTKSIGIPQHTHDKYLIGTTCIPFVRTVVCNEIAAMNTGDLPAFEDQEKMLRTLQKLSQLDEPERSVMLRKVLKSNTLDWSNDIVFGQLVKCAIDDPKLGAQKLASAMSFSISFLIDWTQARGVPLPMIRRRFMRVLYVESFTHSTN